MQVVSFLMSSLVSITGTNKPILTQNQTNPLFDYNEIVLTQNRSSYDSVYFDYEDGPRFIDSEIPNPSDQTINTTSRDDIQFMYDDGDGTSTNGIYGNDDRTFLDSLDSIEWPYCAVCQIFATYSTGSSTITYLSTGSLVGSNVLLTAAHCVYNDTYGWPTNFVVYPGYCEGYYEFGSATMVASYIGNYFNTFDSNDDWAFVKLDWNIGDETGYYSVQNVSLSYGDTGRNIAYQGSSYCMSNTLGGIYGVYDYKFYHRIDAVAGSSGSPIFKSGSLAVCGIHSAGIHTQNFDYNIACRITLYLQSLCQTLRNQWAI